MFGGFTCDCFTEDLVERDMLTKKRAMTAAVTLVLAAATGHLMQYGMAGATRMAADASIPAETAEPQPTVQPARLVENALPTPPLEALLPASLPSRPISRVRVPHDTVGVPTAFIRRDLSGFGMPCDIVARAEAGQAAMVTLTVDANCRPDARVEIFHGEIVFSAQTSSLGQFQVTLPAMMAQAQFSVLFEDGQSALAEVAVPDFDDYARVAVKWTGASGLSLHAREFGAQFGAHGHVSAERPKSPLRSLGGNGGFLTHLGDPALEAARQVEIYAFPAGFSTRPGVVRLNVEAQVTAQSCGRNVFATALESDPSGGYRKTELAIEMPGCEAVGNILMLDNVLQDLRLARN